MFPEYRQLITVLKESNPRFRSLFEKHNQLDHDIAQLEHPDGRGYCDKVATMKKEKLKLKETLWEMLKEADNAAS
ncbi:DUF465 domain-containing protein [Enterobacteriaceae bacterium YMB-R22]|uniref:DUF465 domain-containing protein n=3 Tax=Enterobacteriaceae TaxID=543 RepID=A0A8K0V8P0_9ENTR|nr:MULTISPECIES: DUF465 domain-containing protein [Tenebrionibacter/Tenebrionicola group]MBK4716230.1 DUF465 domain-containing protein [Tenebrionibacter intestinalis]MBV4411304.1 DUF465 domain-containing protein [Tenebrionicola larvae]MBV5096885.1 DUF465 domain-containing protein [Tenebrionicola larvae]